MTAEAMTPNWSMFMLTTILSIPSLVSLWPKMAQPSGILARASFKYRIEVKDYSEFDTDGTGQASLQKLNTEILAGNVPDLLDTSSIPLRQYGC